MWVHVERECASPESAHSRHSPSRQHSGLWAKISGVCSLCDRVPVSSQRPFAYLVLAVLPAYLMLPQYLGVCGRSQHMACTPPNSMKRGRPQMFSRECQSGGFACPTVSIAVPINVQPMWGRTAGTSGDLVFMLRDRLCADRLGSLSCLTACSRFFLLFVRGVLGRSHGPLVYQEATRTAWRPAHFQTAVCACLYRQYSCFRRCRSELGMRRAMKRGRRTHTSIGTCGVRGVARA